MADSKMRQLFLERSLLGHALDPVQPERPGVVIVTGGTLACPDSADIAQFFAGLFCVGHQSLDHFRIGGGQIVFFAYIRIEINQLQLARIALLIAPAAAVPFFLERQIQLPLAGAHGL